MATYLLLAWTPFDPWHLLVIMVVALLLFGKRLPEIGRSLGRGIMEFKKGLKDVQDEMNRGDERPHERPRLDETTRPTSGEGTVKRTPEPVETKSHDPS